MLEKQRATFEFEVNEDDIEGRWLRNGVEIQFTVDQRFNYVIIRKMHRLTITETYRSDAGEYTFIAGKNRSIVTLHVNSEFDLWFFLVHTVKMSTLVKKNKKNPIPKFI